MEKHLKPKEHYIDRYDRVTVERCRWYENAITDEDIQKQHKKKLDKEELVRMRKAFTDLQVYFVKGELYKQKEETISKWMKADEDLDNFCESATAPKDIRCLTCDREMFVSHSHLETHLDALPRMLYMYDCTLGHLPRRALYDNGEEWSREKPRCPKCSTEVDEKDEDTDKLFKTVLTCASCGNVEVREIDRTANKKEKPDPNFEKDRERFCNAEEGRKYVDWMIKAEELTKLIEKHKEKENNKELYDKVEKLKKLSVPHIKKLLTESLEKEAYTNLVFEQPDIGRIVSIGFSIEDPTEQGEYDSRTRLARVIKKTLDDTNWRLMSEGINYRLGILSGSLRAYEKEEDLVKLVKSRG